MVGSRCLSWLLAVVLAVVAAPDLRAEDLVTGELLIRGAQLEAGGMGVFHCR